VTSLFLFSFEDGGTEKAVRQSFTLLTSFFLAICVHAFVGEVDNGVLRVYGPSAPSLLKVAFARSAGGCAFSCFVPNFLEIFEENFLFGGSTMRCRVPSSSAMDEMVPKQNADPVRRTLLC
jgi:hypothetical protein